MKNIYLILIASLLALVGCDDDYKLSTDFTTPSVLKSPEYVTLDVESKEKIVLSWEGGGAADGSYVFYDILFDKVGGDFSNPIEWNNKEYDGVSPKVSLSHEALNVIARKAGITPLQSGDVIWTITASKGGVVTPSGISRKITLERPAGIDVIPENLYLFGSATENGGNKGLQFRRINDGVFVIYTKIENAGVLQLKSGTASTDANYYLQDNKIVEGEGDFAIEPSDKVYRITVNFNTLGIRTEKIGAVRVIWGVTFGTIANLNYVGDGIFKADNCVIEFVDPSRPQTNPPGWLSWIEDRYYFIGDVDGTEKCWGRMDNVSAENPVGGEPLSFYELGEFAWSQWDHLWKMSKSLDKKKATISINTNKENLKIHEFTNVVPL